MKTLERSLDVCKVEWEPKSALWSCLSTRGPRDAGLEWAQYVKIQLGCRSIVGSGLYPPFLDFPSSGGVFGPSPACHHFGDLDLTPRVCGDRNKGVLVTRPTTPPGPEGRPGWHCAAGVRRPVPSSCHPFK